MKYRGVPSMMWMLYKKSFQKALVSVMKMENKSAKKLMKKAKTDYKKIILDVPSFEKKDPFLTNIVNCALLTAVTLHMEKRPTVKELTDYYEAAMTNKFTKMFCRMGKTFSSKTTNGYQKKATYKCGERNEYSWSFDYLPYPDGSGYECRFFTCGICKLMTKYGLSDLIPAMCHLDYVMAEFRGDARFVRKYTLASGGPYCDCGYKKLKK